jgi:hypothetical protein
MAPPRPHRSVAGADPAAGHVTVVASILARIDDSRTIPPWMGGRVQYKWPEPTVLQACPEYVNEGACLSHLS